jgi:hypothetical protein
MDVGTNKSSYAIVTDCLRIPFPENTLEGFLPHDGVTHDYYIDAWINQSSKSFTILPAGEVPEDYLPFGTIQPVVELN